MKEEKVDIDLLTAAQNGTITLSNQGAINLGTFLAPGTNETISIVIPLSAQLATLRNSTIQPQMICKQEPGIDNIVIENIMGNEKKLTASKRKAPANRIKEDKTKGCPYPNCSRYGRAFSRAHDLKRHIARHEVRENKPEVQTQQVVYPCMVCGAIFYNEQVLQKHQLIHDNGDMIPTVLGPPYTCNFCNKNFESEDILNAHLPIHIKAEPVLMFQPGNAAQGMTRLPPPPLVSTSSTLTSVATTDSSITPDDDFRIEDMLLIRKTSSTNKPVTHNATASTSTATGAAASKIRCEYCSKTFKTKWTLSSHVAAHEGRFQYQCCICSKRFVRKSHYESHVRSHDAARPYVCEHCGKTFKESKHRREHLKRKHPANRHAIQSLLDSISACVNEDTATGVAATTDPSKLTILMPMNFTS